MTIQRARVLGGIGILSSLAWLALNSLLAPDWGPPGSRNYLSYETINRLWGPAFLGILAGFWGLFTRFQVAGRQGRAARTAITGGLAAMMAGNVAEFWLFTDQAYGELNGRNVAWFVVLLGMLSLLIGCGLLGAAGLRQGLWPAWASALLLLALPLTIILIIVATSAMFLMLVVVGVLAGGLALGAITEQPPLEVRA